MILTLISWNSTGLIARMEKGELSPLLRHNPEIVCLQDTRIAGTAVPDRLRSIHGYYSHFSELWRGMDNGVGMISRISPKAVTFGAGDPRTDGQGQVMTADFGIFSLVNAYVPVGDGKPFSMNDKLSFLDGLLDTIVRLQELNRPVIVCGDFNIAHTDQDLRNPDESGPGITGTTVEERSRLDRLIGLRFFDALRLFDQRADAFTCWNSSKNLRQQGTGWRGDYFFVSNDLRDNVRGCSVIEGIQGSNHCPISLELEVAEPAGAV